MYKLDDIELKKSCNMIEWIINYLQQERVRYVKPFILLIDVYLHIPMQDMYGESYAVVQHVESYLVRHFEAIQAFVTTILIVLQDELQKWIGESQLFFQESTQKRAEEQVTQADLILRLVLTIFS